MATVDPYAGFEARIVPENITLLPKTTTQATGGNGVNEKLVVAKKGDSVVGILRDLGASGPTTSMRLLARARTSQLRRRHQGRSETAHPDGASARRSRACSRSA